MTLADAASAGPRASAGTSSRVLAALGLPPSYSDGATGEAEGAVAELLALSRQAVRFFHALLAQAPAGPARNTFTCPQSPVALLQEPCVVLPVPLIRQHKDTQMLLLERPVDSGAPHPWDADHGDLDEDDPADNANCVLASLAMMNRHAGADMSQDRIGYEIFSARSGGPELDLMHGEGLNFAELEQGYRFALGTAPVRMAPGHLEALWTNLKNQIDRGRPMLAVLPGHAFVVVGYRISNGDRIIIANDPWERTPQEIDLGDAAGIAQASTWWHWTSARNFVPRSQEATITQDSDGDGVVDFDETERFRTDPRDPDTDADGVGDKRDIAASVFDAAYGYALHGTGRDEDGDGRPMELDPDSDAGGCRDGEEDKNGNGVYESAVVQQVETWNFKFPDDSCRGLAGHLTYRVHSSGWVVPDRQWGDVESQTSISVRLKPVPDQPGYYEDDGSTFHYRGSHYGLTLAENCRMIGRSWASSSGDFTGDGAAPATGQLTDDGRLAVHFTAGIPWDDTGGWSSICGIEASGKAGDSHSAEFNDDCWGDPVEPGEPGYVIGQKIFRFNCHNQQWNATGTVIVP